MPGACEVAITSLHRPEKTTSPTAPQQNASVLGWGFEYQNLLLSVPRNDKRTGQVDFSFDDPICELLYENATDAVTGHQIQVTTAFEIMLFIRWRGTPAIWAPIVAMDWRGADRLVTVSAVDVQRLIDHQLHRGDTAFENRYVMGTSDGIRDVLAAAAMTTDQLNDGTPNHGINAPDPLIGATGAADLQVGVDLDDGVWDKIVEIGSYQEAVDFSVIPRDVEDPSAYPYYADLTCYDEQGSDLTDYVFFEAGFGRDNAESMDWSPGGTYMTHAIVRDSANKHRVIVANLDARRRTGAYVHVENLPSKSPPGTMTARANALIKQYSFPVDSHSIVLKDDDPRLDGLQNTTFHVPYDFDNGDTIVCETRDAYYHKRVTGQVNEWRLRQDGPGPVKEEIDVVPELVDVTELGDDDL